VVPQAGHLANLDNPRAYNDFVRQFLARLARAAA
jgi:pimeloyl-ACP methyl ester carboxylesterase